MTNTPFILTFVVLPCVLLVASDDYGSARDAPDPAVWAVGSISSCANLDGPESSGKRVIRVIIVIHRCNLMQRDAEPCDLLPRPMTRDDDPVTQERVTMTRSSLVASSPSPRISPATDADDTADAAGGELPGTPFDSRS